MQRSLKKSLAASSRQGQCSTVPRFEWVSFVLYEIQLQTFLKRGTLEHHTLSYCCIKFIFYLFLYMVGNEKIFCTKYKLQYIALFEAGRFTVAA